ncbi:MAG: Brix domain-containing protein [Piptocephalis tieghemiana]|nr:MAG: Brix domain-containing protein [Piptocephalis tieghemiana]
MIRTVKAKNARSKRALDNRAPKVTENVKTAIFVRGTTTSQVVNTALSDLLALKKPFGIHFSKKNDIHPFDNETSLEFFSQKNDASLFLVGTHSKKRPNNLILARMFDHHLLDMIELGVERLVPMADFKTGKCAIGMRPCFLFNGELFDRREDYRNLKNMLVDFYRGEVVESVNLAGLEYVISVTAGPLGPDDSPGLIYFRVYTISLKKSGSRLPRVELEEMGPSMDLRVRRTRPANEDTLKLATRVPKEKLIKKRKNIHHDPMGDKYGRIHMESQDLSKLQTRKMRGLRRADPADLPESGEDANGADEDDEEEEES